MAGAHYATSCGESVRNVAVAFAGSGHRLASMPAMFTLYLLLIAAGLALYTVIGLVHH